MHYVEQGSGEPVILIHGNNSSSVWWEYTLERMKDSPYRFIAPDLRGRGDTSGPAANWTVEMLAADVRRLIEQLGIGAAHVVGHSLGANVAIQYALDHRRDVKSLLLLNPGWVAGEIPDAIADQARLEQMVANKDLLKMALRGAAMKHPDNDAWKRLLDASLKQRDEATLCGGTALKAWNVAAQLGTLEGIPTTVVRGEGDVYISTEVVCQSIVSRIPGAKYVTIPGATHSPNVETPDAWVAILRQHLDKTR
jgi:pimeloyl-ACP methyl ester carboxylesterase